MLLLISSILPVIVLLVYIYRKDELEKEPIGLLIGAFLFGILSALITIAILTPFCELESMNGLFAQSFLMAAIPEESLKFLMLYQFIWKNKNFNEYFDGIVYAVFVSLGFACFENILYVIDGGMRVAFVRAIITVPAHFLFAVIMGYYFSMARFNSQTKYKYLIISLVYPILVHGIFDFLLFYFDFLSEINFGLALIVMIGFFAFDIFLWHIGAKRIRLHHKRSSPDNSLDNNTFSDTFHE